MRDRRLLVEHRSVERLLAAWPRWVRGHELRQASAPRPVAVSFLSSALTHLARSRGERGRDGATSFDSGRAENPAGTARDRARSRSRSATASSHPTAWTGRETSTDQGRSTGGALDVEPLGLAAFALGRLLGTARPLTSVTAGGVAELATQGLEHLEVALARLPARRLVLELVLGRDELAALRAEIRRAGAGVGGRRLPNRSPLESNGFFRTIDDVDWEDLTGAGSLDGGAGVAADGWCSTGPRRDIALRPRHDRDGFRLIAGQGGNVDTASLASPSSSLRRACGASNRRWSRGQSGRAELASARRPRPCSPGRTSSPPTRRESPRIRAESRRLLS